MFLVCAFYPHTCLCVLTRFYSQPDVQMEVRRTRPVWAGLGLLNDYIVPKTHAGFSLTHARTAGEEDRSTDQCRVENSTGQDNTPIT